MGQGLRTPKKDITGRKGKNLNMDLKQDTYLIQRKNLLLMITVRTSPWGKHKKKKKKRTLLVLRKYTTY